MSDDRRKVEEGKSRKRKLTRDLNAMRKRGLGTARKGKSQDSLSTSYTSLSFRQSPHPTTSTATTASTSVAPTEGTTTTATATVGSTVTRARSSPASPRSLKTRQDEKP